MMSVFVNLNTYLAFEPHGRLSENGGRACPPLVVILVIFIILFFAAFTEAALPQRRRIIQPGDHRKLCQPLSRPFRSSGFGASLFPGGAPSSIGGYGGVPGHVQRVKGCRLCLSIQGEKGGGAAGRACRFPSLRPVLIFVVLVLHWADLGWPSHPLAVLHLAPRPVFWRAPPWSALSVCWGKRSCWFWDRRWAADGRGGGRALANGKPQEALSLIFLFFVIVVVVLLFPLLRLAHVPGQRWDLVTWFDLFT